MLDKQVFRAAAEVSGRLVESRVASLRPGLVGGGRICLVSGLMLDDRTNWEFSKKEAEPCSIC